MLAWLLLFAAIAFEVAAMAQMKLSNGFTKVDCSILTIVFFVFSFAAAAYAFKRIDLSLAYSLWSGIGTIGIAAVGILMFNEPSNLPKFLFSALILVGVIGLNSH